jgi:hypothetical protein
MLAVSDNGVSQGLHANRTLFLALDDKLERLLQEATVFVIERDNVLFLEEVHEIGDTLFAQGPMIASVSVSVDRLKPGKGTHVWRRRSSLSRTPWNLPF